MIFSGNASFYHQMDYGFRIAEVILQTDFGGLPMPSAEQGVFCGTKTCHLVARSLEMPINTGERGSDMLLEHVTLLVT